MLPKRFEVTTMGYITQTALMVKIYDPSLTPVLKTFATEEGVSWIIFNETKEYIEYQLNYPQNVNTETEQRLSDRLSPPSDTIK